MLPSEMLREFDLESESDEVETEIEGLSSFLELADLRHIFEEAKEVLLAWGAVSIDEMLDDPESLDEFETILQLNFVHKRLFRRAADKWRRLREAPGKGTCGMAAVSMAALREEAAESTTVATEDVATEDTTTSALAESVEEGGEDRQEQAPKDLSEDSPEKAVMDQDAAAQETTSEAENSCVALAEAVQSNDLNGAARLIALGANLNSLDWMGEPPLFQAVACGNDDMIALLLLAQADPKVESATGLTLAEQVERDDHLADSRQLLFWLGKADPDD